jgi:cardiolipin synthase A/B
VKQLLDAVIALVANTPIDKMEQLAHSVGQLTDSSKASRILDWAPNPNSKARLASLIAAWQSERIPSCELSGILLGASVAYHYARSEQEIELVWTGPSTASVAMRKTEQALIQVIDAATERLFITSLVAYSVPSIMRALESAIRRNVKISMLLEESDEHSGSISFDLIGKMKIALPTANIFSWADKGERFGGGKVHAKIVVADERECFVSSANLTGHAMAKNMEAGILIRGGTVPRDLHRHLEALETMHLVVKV